MPAHKKPELTERIREMRKTMSAKQIAEALGISKAAVFYHLRLPREIVVDSSPE